MKLETVWDPAIPSDWRRVNGWIDLHPKAAAANETGLPPTVRHLYWVAPRPGAGEPAPWNGWPELNRRPDLRITATGPLQALRRKLTPGEGWLLPCGDDGRLSPLQKLIALRAGRGIVVKHHPVQTWAPWQPADRRARWIRQLATLPLLPFEWIRLIRDRWLKQRILTRADWGSAFCRRYRLPIPSKGSPQHFLDLGCGWGRYSAPLALLGHEVVGIDPRIAEADWNRIPGALFLRGSAEDLNRFRPESFDGVLAMGVLLYLPDPAGTLKTIRRILKPGGWLLTQTANRDNPWTRRTGRPLWPGEPVQGYVSREGLERLMTEAGFDIRTIWSHGWVSPRLPRAAAWITEVLLPQRLFRLLEPAVPERFRKQWVVLGVKPR